MSNDNLTNDLTSDILAQALITFGLGTAVASDLTWPIFSTKHPDEPNNLICIYNTTPTTQGREHVTGETIEQKGIQLKVRSSNIKTGFLKATTIAAALDTLLYRTSVTLGGSVYLIQAVTRTSGVIYLGPEQPEVFRHAYTINAKVTLRQTS